jgi:acyl-CoA thioester hydrolase
MTPFLTPLGADDLRAENIPAPWSFGMADRVRFGEIDVLGHVNNAAYLRWFENLRIHYFRDYGVASYTDAPPKIVLRNIGLDFKAEVKLNDNYILTGRTVEVRTNSFTMHYGVYVGGTLTTSGSAVIVSLNQDNSKRPLSETLRQTFVTRDQATQV